ncbi:UrcA family protein [Sphingomonas morindae]|uniref:UrcA family protein n=1 Tax=Sphingomonas morindae TaxID=1541170 RepID=A0ABY4X5M5_9SPHN|nr:UrcA family protein [Sphingomonas morindae]USI72176.1 UrcA family protein [Sphingomonas morindae]
MSPPKQAVRRAQGSQEINMTCSTFTAALAAALALAPATPLLAQLREPVTARVEVAGLDLGRPADRALFFHRLKRASARACDNGSATPAMRADSARCRREMEADAVQRLAAYQAPGVEVTLR